MLPFENRLDLDFSVLNPQDHNLDLLKKSLLDLHQKAFSPVKPALADSIGIKNRTILELKESCEKTLVSISHLASTALKCAGRKRKASHLEASAYGFVSKEDRIKFLTHVFLDRQLTGSSYEGAHFSQVIPCLLDLSSSIPDYGFKKDLFIKDMQKLESQEASLIASLSITKSEFHKELVRAYKSSISELESIDRNSKNILGHVVNLPAIKDRISSFFPSSRVHEEKVVLCFHEILLEFYTAITALVSAENFIEILGEEFDFPADPVQSALLKQDCIQKLSVIISLKEWQHSQNACKENLITQLFNKSKQSFSHIASSIHEDLMKLGVGETYIMQSGFWGYPEPHAMLVRFIKKSSGLWDLHIINSGQGLNNHDLVSTSKKTFISPLLKFENIPEEFIFVQNESGSPLFLERFFDFRSPFYFQLCQMMQLEPICDQLYKHIQMYLAPFVIRRHDEKSRYITQQKSGTCVYRSLKALLPEYFETYPDYKNWILAMKSQLLKCCFIENKESLESDTSDSLELRDIFHLSTRNFASSLEKVAYSSSSTASHLQELLAPIIYIQDFLSALENPPSPSLDANYLPLKSLFQIGEESLGYQGPIDAIFEKIKLEVELSKKKQAQLPPTTLELHKLLPILELPALSILPSTLAEELAKAYRIFRSDTIKHTPWIREFIFSIEASKITPDVISPEDCLACIETLFAISDGFKTFINFSESSLNFSTSLSIAILIYKLSLIIHPEILADLPIECFGLTDSRFIPYFKCSSLTQIIGMNLAVTNLQIINANKPTYAAKLFSQVNHYKLEFDSSFQTPKIKDATYELYSRILEANPKFKDSLLKSYPEARCNNAELVSHLVADLSPHDGQLRAAGFPAIGYLKCLFAKLSRILNMETMVPPNPHLEIEHTRRRLDFHFCDFKRRLEVFSIINSPLGLSYNDSDPTFLMALVTQQIAISDTQRADWSKAPLETKESILLKYQREISKLVPIEDKIAKEVVLQLLIFSLNPSLKISKTLQYFSNKSIFLTLSNKLIVELFCGVVFSAYQLNPIGDWFFKQNKHFEHIRVLTENFFRTALEFIHQSKDPKVFSWLINQLFVTCEYLSDLPFFLDLEDILAEYSKTQRDFQFWLFDYLLRVGRKTENKVPKLKALLEIACEFKLDIQSYDYQKFILRIRDYLMDRSQQESLLPVVLKLLESKLTLGKVLDFFYCPNTLFFWVELEGQSVGLNLSTLSLAIREDKKIRFVQSSHQGFSHDYLSRSIFHIFPNKSFSEFSHDERALNSPIGTLSISKGSNLLKFRPNESFLQNLPENLRRNEFFVITDQVVNKSAHSLDPQAPIRAESVYSKGCILEYLPYESHDIAHLLHTYDDEHHYLVSLDQKLKPNLVVKIRENDHVITDLSNNSSIHINTDHDLKPLIDDRPLVFCKSAQRISLVMHSDHGKLVLNLNGSEVELDSNPNFILVETLRNILMPHAFALEFVNKKDAKLKKLFAKLDFFSGIGIKPKKPRRSYTKKFETKIFLEYDLVDDQIHSKELRGEIYLVYLKILSRQKDSYSALMKLVNRLRTMASFPKEDLEIMQLFIHYCNDQFGLFGQHKDMLSILYLHLYYSLSLVSKTHERPPITSSICYHYDQMAKIPPFARIPAFELKVLLSLIKPEEVYPEFHSQKVMTDSSINLSQVELKESFISISGQLELGDLNLESLDHDEYKSYLVSERLLSTSSGTACPLNQEISFFELFKLALKDDKKKKQELLFQLTNKMSSRDQPDVGDYLILALLLNPKLEVLFDLNSIENVDCLERFITDPTFKELVESTLKEHLKELSASESEYESEDEDPPAAKRVLLEGQAKPEKPLRVQSDFRRPLDRRIEPSTFRKFFKATTLFSKSTITYEHQLLEKNLHFFAFYETTMQVMEVSSGLLSSIFVVAKPLVNVSEGSTVPRFFRLNQLAVNPENFSSRLNDDYEISRVNLETYHYVTKTTILAVQSIIKEFEERLMKAVNNPPFLDSDEQPILTFHQLAYEHSNQKAQYYFDDLLHAFLDGSKESYHLLLGVDQLENPKTAMIDEFIEFIDDNIGRLLVLKIESQKLKRFQSALKSSDLEELKVLLSTIFFQERSLDDQTRNVLVYEYLTGFQIRNNQTSLITDFTRLSDGFYVNQVAQLMMGGGKTSVITPILAQACSVEGRISIFLTPRSQKKSVFPHLLKTQASVFKQQVVDLELSRSDMNVSRLKFFYEQLKAAKTASTLIISSPETIQGLELEFLSSLQHPEETEKHSILRRILQKLKTDTDCIIDEFASVADVSKLTNYPSSSVEDLHKKIQPEKIELYRKIFEFLTSSSYTIDGQSIRSLTKLDLNEQMYITVETWQTILPHVAAFMAEFIQQQYPLFLSRDEIFSFLSNPAISPKISIELQAPENSQAKQQLALVHFTLHNLLPKLFKKCCGRNYGRSKSLNSGKIVPYQGVDSPTNTEFGFAYECLAYHFFTAAYFGVSAEQLKFLAQEYRCKAAVKSKASCLKIDETPEGVEFFYLTGVLLAKADDETEIRKGLVKLQQEKEQGNFTNIFKLEAKTCEYYVGFYPNYFSSNPHNLLRQFSTVRGFTGTPWNHATYPLELRKNTKLDTSVDQKISERINGYETLYKNGQLVLGVNDPLPQRILTQIALELTDENMSKVQGIIDTGGIFKDFSNEAVALSILDFLRSTLGDKPKFGVIYFDKTDQAILCDSPTALVFDQITGSTTKVTLSDFYSISRDCGLSCDDYFVYFDERHTIGTDIPLKTHAICVLTLDEKTPFHQMSQGLLRMRGFFKSQNALFVAPQALLNTSPSHFETTQSLLEFLNGNQRVELSKILFKSYRQQFDDLFRGWIIQHLIAQENPAAKWDSFKDFLSTTEEDDAIKILSESKTESPILQLYSYSMELLGKFIDRFGHPPEDEIMQQFDYLAKQLTLDEANLFYCEELQLAQEVVVEQETQVQQSLLQELESDIYEELQNDVNPPRTPPRGPCVIDFSDLISKLVSISDSSSIKYQGLSKLPLDESYGVLFDQLYFSENIFNVFEGRSESIFSRYKKAISSILAIITPQGSLITIALTSIESLKVSECFFKGFHPNAFLLSIRGELRSTNPYELNLRDEKHLAHLRKAYLEAHLINGDIDFLTEFSDEIRLLAADKTLVSSKEEETLKGSLFIRLIKILMAKSKKESFLSILNSMISGQLSEALEIERLLAEEKIKAAQEAFRIGDKQGTEKILKTLPKKWVDLTPDDLVECLSLSHIPHLKAAGKIRRLSEANHKYIRASQISSLEFDKVAETLYKQKRVDLFIALELLNPTENQTLVQAKKIDLAGLKAISKPYSLFNHSEIMGFPNLGSTCFAASVLKALFTLGSFPDLLRSPLSIYPGESAEAFELRKSFQDLLISLHEAYMSRGDRIYVQLRQFYQHPLFVQKNLKMMREQADADEFYKVISQALGLEDSEHTTLFLKGQKTSMIPLNFVIPGLDRVEIQNLIDTFMQDIGPIFHLNPSLLRHIGIQLPRFKTQTEKNSQVFLGILSDVKIKIETPVGFNILTLSPKSVVCHKGSLTSGHYFTVSKDKEFWLHHSDSFVTKVYARQILSETEENGYLVFYEIKEITPV